MGGSGVRGGREKNTTEGILGRESMLSPNFSALITGTNESENAEAQNARGRGLAGKGLGHNMPS